MPEQDTLMGGYRVLDLAQDGFELCGKILGDLGADVIQIEPPGGSPTRNHGPFYHDIPDPEKSLFWFFVGLNKRGITLNLETTEGREIFKRLVKTADIVVESFEPGYMKSLGLGYEELEKINPRLIMTSITPFGQTGPYAHYKCSDLVGQGMAGLQRLYGDDITRAPVRIGQPQFYFQGGLQGALGSMMAFYHREMTGEGQHVDVSAQQGTVLQLMIAAEIWDILKINYRGGLALRPPTAPPLVGRQVFPCKDGHVLWFPGGGELGAARSTKNLVEFANEHGYALELKDYDWVGGWNILEMDQETYDRLLAPIEKFFLNMTKMELFEGAAREGKEFRVAPINTAADVLKFPQYLAREFFEKVEHPELGETLTYPGWPIKLWGPNFTPFITHKYQRRAPLIGEHNEEVYHKELGIPKEELVLLKTNGVI